MSTGVLALAGLVGFYLELSGVSSALIIFVGLSMVFAK